MGGCAMQAQPLLGSHGFGAVVTGVPDLSLVTDPEHAQIQALLDEHQVLVFRGQPPSLDPERLASFIHAFDPEARTVWRDQATNPWERYKAEHLGGAGTFQLPEPRQSTLVLGKGEVKDHWGLNAVLGGARAAYGKTSGSQVIGGGFLQWHVDGAFWQAPSTDATGWPCRVVGMRCVEAPADGAMMHEINMGDGSVLSSPLGATAFVSGQTAWNLLTPEERHSALRTTVVYAQHPFKRFGRLGMTTDGLRCAGGDDQETLVGEAEGGAALRLPLVWTHPSSGRQALMVNTRCVAHLELHLGVDGHTPEDNHNVRVIALPEARAWLHTLMRRAVEPSLVYAHGWKAGDVAIWDNLAVWHSATGGLRSDDRRVMHLHAFDGSKAPVSRVHPEPRRLLCLVIGQTPRPDLLATLAAHMRAADGGEESGGAEPGAKRRRQEPWAVVTAQRFCFKHPRAGPMELDVFQAGALDGASPEVINALRPEAGDDAQGCPLVTRLRDGGQVVVDEDKLEPLMQGRLSALDGSGCRADAVVLLCAGAFPNLRAAAARPIFRPFDCGVAVVEALGVASVLLLVPTCDQRLHSLRRWQSRLPRLRFDAARLAPCPAPSDIGEAAAAIAASDCDAVVLDFVGHAPGVVEDLRKELRGCAAGRQAPVLFDLGEVALKQVAAALF